MSIKFQPWIMILVALLLAGCGTPAVVEPTAQPTPAPPPALLGYVGDPPDSPAVFVEVVQGMSIEISDATYNPENIAVGQL